MKSEKQMLVDLMFQMVLVTTNDLEFCKKSREERMKWVADTLRECEIDTHPIGSSWGVIVDKQMREKLNTL